MGAQASSDAYKDITLVNPKELPVLIALDLGYSEKEIYCCYEPNISAVTLVERLCDFDTALTDSIVEFKQQCALAKLNKEKEDSFKKLYEETQLLYTNTLCLNCFRNKRSKVAIPCGHLKVCGQCKSTYCITCDQLVSDYVQVFTP